MESQFTKIKSYDFFEKNFLPIITSSEYDEIVKASEKLSIKIDQKINKPNSNRSLYIPKCFPTNGQGNVRSGPAIMNVTKINYINEMLRNEQDIFLKQLMTINILFKDHDIERILELSGTTIEDFVNGLLKIKILIALGKDFDKESASIIKALNYFTKFYCTDNYNLFILKIYELYYKKTLEKEKQNRLKLI